jgi:hypothetical protein
MTLYRAGLADHGGSIELVVFDLPGCNVLGRDREEALELAALVIESHLAWLLWHGLPTPGGLGGLEIVEDMRADRTKAADGEFCFEDDMRPVTPEDIASGIAVMAASRADLTALIGGCPSVLLEWRPPLAAMAHVDEWKPHALTIAEIAEDVAGAESYYRRGLEDGCQSDDGSGATPQLEIERMLLIDTLGALSREDRGRRFEPQRAWQSSPEHWTARKVIRRVISHERFHTAEIQQRLSWLQLGVPRFRD